MSPQPRQPRADALQITFPADRHAPAVARSAAKGFFSDRALSASQRHAVVLLVSELVTNAVQHSPAPAGAPIALSLQMRHETLRVEVTDHGGGFAPRPRDPARVAGGYGLQLVERVARRWGVDREGGTRVWFELPSVAPAVARPA